MSMKNLLMGVFVFLGLFSLKTTQAQEIIAELDDIAFTSVCDINVSSDGNIILMGRLGIKKITPDGDLLWSYLSEENELFLQNGAISFIERSNGNLLFPMNRNGDYAPVVAEFSQAGELLNYIAIEGITYPRSSPVAIIEMPNQSVIASIAYINNGGFIEHSNQIVKISADLTSFEILTEQNVVNASAVAPFDADHFLAAIHQEGVAIISTAGEILSIESPSYNPSYNRLVQVNNDLYVAISYSPSYPESTGTLSYYDGDGEYLTYTTVPAEYFWDIALDTDESYIYVSGENLDGKSTVWTFDYAGTNTGIFSLDELDVVGDAVAYLNGYVYTAGNSSEYQKTLVVKIPKALVTATPELENSVNVTLYPNPAREKVVFETDCKQSTNCVVVVRNLQGQVVARLLLESGQAIWQAENCARGIYLYAIETENGVVSSGKLLLQ